MKSALKFGQKSAFKTKTYSTPSKQKESTGSTHESVHGQDDSKRESKRDSNRGNKQLKEWLMTNKGFNQVDADKMIKEGAYTYKDMLKDMGIGGRHGDVDGDVSPTKQKTVKNKGHMEGPIPEQNLGLQPGENDGSWIYGRGYEGDDPKEGLAEMKADEKTTGKKFVKRERMIDYDERAGVIEQNELMDLEGDNSPKANKKRKQLKATIKTLDREQQIMRDRTDSPAKQTKSGRGNIFTKKGRVQRKINKGKIPAPLKPISNPGIKNVPGKMVSITRVPQKYVTPREQPIPRNIKKKKRFL